MNFDHKKFTVNSQNTIIGKAIGIGFIFSNPLIKFLMLLIWLSGVASLLVLVAGAFGIVEATIKLFGLSYLVFGVFVIYLMCRQFFISKLKYPKPLGLKKAIEQIKTGQKFNLFRVFSFQLALVWERNIGWDYENRNAQEILLALLKSSDMNFILLRIGISRQNLSKVIKGMAWGDVLDVVLRSLQIAQAESHHQIEVGDVFVAIVEKSPKLKKFFSDINLEMTDLLNIVYWQTSSIRASIRAKKRFFDPDDLHLSGGVGRDWAFGYAQFLKQYSRDLTEAISDQGLGLELIGHDKEIKMMEEALSRRKGGNAILVGEPGVGKRTTVLGFAKKVLEGKAMGVLKNKHVVELDIDAILSGAGDKSELTGRINTILSQAARAGNMIVYIENIQNMLSSGEAGKVNALEVLLPYLETPQLYIVGTCDIGSYNRFIEPNGAFVSHFTKINIEEPTKKEMLRILEDVVPTIEYHTKSLVTYEVIKEAITAADKYILNLPNPEKSINLLDGAAAKATADRGKTIVTSKDIDNYVTEKFDVPSSEVGVSEKKKLLQLEEVMHQRVIGQNEAIDAISNAMRRSRAAIVDSKKPIGSFLFLGPTGVGKTETAKALAEAYFGEEERMIRFDMSEYQNKQDVYRLIGGNIGGEELQGVLTVKVREKPFSLILFDEIEKAHPDILNLFLQVLDEGRITDGFGRKVSFTNTIIIATSNAGANLIRQSVQSGVEYEKLKKQLIDYLQQQNIYRPEFLNRFSGVIVFSPLSREQIGKIAKIMVDKLIVSIAKSKGVKLKVTLDAVNKLAQIGFDPQLGARPMTRAIQEKLENMLAKQLLSGKLKKGDTIVVDDSMI